MKIPLIIAMIIVWGSLGLQQLHLITLGELICIDLLAVIMGINVTKFLEEN